MNRMILSLIAFFFGLSLFGCTELTSTQSPRKQTEQNMNFKNIGDARQIVLVTTDSWRNIHATLTAYEKTNDTWQPVIGPVKAVVGRSGFSRDKREGDGTSPAGVFRIGPFFGNAPQPEDFKFPYRQITENDCWVDDPDSPFYNTWQTGPADGRWNSAEELKRVGDLYKYVALIHYNIPPVPGKGSAVFFHLWRDENTPTVGCTALAEADVLSVLRWLDPEKKPVILQGPEEFIETYKTGD
jgi:L,D-peptidoglycan transpeptidase YkuD (ErfK/YbiS/YcfS/YnhG family)